MVTSHDVARLAGVSQPTVSRALRGGQRVSEATRQKVLDAAEALGYEPNAVGRALSTGRSTRVGVIVTDLHNQFYQHVIAPMHDQLQELGYEMVLVTESSETAGVADLAVAAGLCGVVLTTTTTDSVLPVRLRDRGVPFVYFNRVAQNTEADAVVVDPASGVAEMVQAVVDCGHCNVGAIFGPKNTSTGESRESVIRDLLQERGIGMLARNVVHGPYDFATGHEATHKLLAQEVPPTLILCSNDVVALGALNAAAERGVAVPEQLSVVGFDDLPSSAWALIRLSTVAFDLDEMSREAVRLLIDRVEGGGEGPAQRKAFPSWYVPRATLAAPVM